MQLWMFACGYAHAWPSNELTDSKWVWKHDEGSPHLSCEVKTYLDYRLPIRRNSRGGTENLPYRSPDVIYQYFYLEDNWMWCNRHEWQHEMHSTVAFWTLRPIEQSPRHDSSYIFNSQMYKDICRGWVWSVWIFIVNSTIKILRKYLLHFKYSHCLGKAVISPYALGTGHTRTFKQQCLPVIMSETSRCS